jgi:hypothetical protein
MQNMRAFYMLKYKSMQRAFILGLVLSLVATSLAPLTACALLSSGLAECPQTATESPCEQMHHHDAESQLSGNADKSCCAVSQAPLPELQYKTAELALAATITVTGNAHALLRTTPPITLLAVEKPSPPSFQSLFCTFLI